MYYFWKYKLIGMDESEEGRVWFCSDDQETCCNAARYFCELWPEKTFEVVEVKSRYVAG